MSFKDSLNKHYAHTQNSVKKYEVGGKVVTKKGATNDAKKGGYFDGRPHSQGGIKAVNIDNNQPIEVEGGEVVITKRAVADDTKKEFQGKMMTNKEILSKINESGGGVSFAKGGEVKIEEDEYYISDEDLNFDIDEKEFADSGTIPEDGFDFTLSELQTRVLKLIDNVTVSDGIVPYAALESVFGDQLRTERTLQLLLADGLIENYAGRIGEYVITSLGKDYLAAQSTQANANQNANNQTESENSVPVLSPIEVKILELINIKNKQNEFAELDYLADALVQKKTSSQDAFTKTDLKNTLKKLNGGVDGKEIYYISQGKGYSGTVKKQYFGITQDGLDYLATQTTQTDSTKVILPENQQRILEIMINEGKSEIPYIQLRDKYIQKFPKSRGGDDVLEAVREMLSSNLIIDSAKGYTIGPLGFDKIDEVRQSNRNQNLQTSNQGNQSREIESIRVKIKDIQDPNGTKNGIVNKYRGPYQKIFENIAVYENYEEYFQDFGKDTKGRDLNEFYVKIINPKFKIDSESAIKEINRLNRVSVTEVVYKNSSATEGVQVNPLFEEFPYFAPDAVKEYNPQVLTVQPRSIAIASSAAGLKNIISEKKKIIEITSQLLQDVPVENVLERVEMSLLLDAEQQELNLLANPNLKYLNILGTGRAFDKNTLDTLIENAQIEQNNLEGRRSIANEKNILGKFKSFLDYCGVNSDSYIANWLSNFFGNWIFYAEYSNYDYALLSDINNLPAAISRVGKVTEVQGKSGLEYMYAPEIVFQGLSKIYDRVGFEVFPISYYAVNYDYADWFATTKGQRLGTQGVILPCILNIRRPLDLSFFGIEKISPTKFFDAVYLQTGLSPEDLKVNPAFLSDSTPDLEVWVYIRSNVEMLKILKESKICDGIHMYENNPAVDVSDKAYQTEVWITFYPEQTKVLPLYKFTDFQQGGNEIDRGWFTKSQFLKSGGTI
jgi:hypothetical protein